MKSFYFNRDVGFVRELQRAFEAKRNLGAAAGDGR
jgi:hypothetical protein